MDLLEVFKDSDDLVEYPAGTVILEEGQHGDRMFVVMRGELSISLKDKVLGNVRPGEIIGEMALINAKVRSATVTAATDCQLAPIDSASFNSMLRYVPDFSMYVMNVLVNRLQTAYELIED
jgi:CRP-like cAMP-binding protein